MSQYRVKKRSARLKAKYKKKKPLWKNQTFRLIVWGIILACSLAYLLLFSPLLAINQIKIISPATLADIAPTIESLVNQKLENHWAFLSIKKTFFLLNTTNLKKEIETTMPQVEGVIIKKEFYHTVTLQLKERIPRAVWCYAGNDVCYLIDKAGIAFQATAEKNLPLIIAESETAPIALPSQVIEPAKMALILRVIGFFQEKLTIAPQNCLTNGQDKLTVKTQEGWEAYFSLTSDLEPILTNLGLLIEKTLPPEKRKNLQYIDLRFSKAYYK